MQKNTIIEKAPSPQISEQFTVKARRDGLTVKFTGNVEDCNEWLHKVSKTFQVLNYEIVFVSAIIEMV